MLDLSWSRNYIVSKILRTLEVAADHCTQPPFQSIRATETWSAKFFVCSAKLYVPVVTWCLNDRIKILKNIKQRFKRTISSNNCRSGKTT